MKTNILILAAGDVAFEADGGYPLCLTEFRGTPLIELIVAKTRHIKNASYTFAVREEDVARFHIGRVLKLLVPNAKIVSVPKGTKGSACTALLAACEFSAHQEVLIISANEYVDIDYSVALDDFRKRKLDGGTFTFRSIHPRYSYVRLDESGLIIETAQQEPISQLATAGMFWFAKAGEMNEALKNLIRKDASVNGIFYVAPAFNEIVLKQGRVGVMPIDYKKYYPLKTERQITSFTHQADA